MQNRCERSGPETYGIIRTEMTYGLWSTAGSKTGIEILFEIIAESGKDTNRIGMGINASFEVDGLEKILQCGFQA